MSTRIISLTITSLLHRFKLSPRYRLAPRDIEDESKGHLIPPSNSSSDSDSEEGFEAPRRFHADANEPWNWKLIFATFGNAAIALVTLTLYLSLNAAGNDKQLLKQTSFYSPFLDLIDFSTRTVQMNGTLFAQDPPPVFRQEPGPDVDAAWEAASRMETLVVHSDDINKLGKDASKAAKYPESFGYGPDAYIAQIDVLHQIHCLDTLRREIHYEHYYEPKYGPKFGNDTGPPLGHKIHVSHCIYLLLQNLMCHANVDVITYNWIDGEHLPFPDFSINHKCRDFGAILNWHKDHSVPIEAYKRLKMPEGFQPPSPIPGMGPIVAEAAWF